jgi:myo-inositol-1-phosphate synthase
MGFNLLGDGDGEVLRDPAHKAAKVRNKDGILARILGYAPDSLVRIDYVKSLGDNKTAWDFVHFEGFLGHKMCLQLTWSGTDSVLAAPLILDMVRLALVARARGETGCMKQLALFFKAPLDVSEDNLHRQYESLARWMAEAAG